MLDVCFESKLSAPFDGLLIDLGDGATRGVNKERRFDFHADGSAAKDQQSKSD